MILTLNMLLEKKNKVAHLLSKWPICNALTVLQFEFIARIGEEVKRDPFYFKIFQSLHVNPLEMHQGTFHLCRGNLYYLNRFCVYLSPHKSKTKIWENVMIHLFVGILGSIKHTTKSKVLSFGLAWNMIFATMFVNVLIVKK